MDGADEEAHSEDNLGSAGSVGETRSPDSKVDDEDDDASDSDGEGRGGVADEDEDGNGTSASDLGLSSPGCSLSSLASPAILPSPTTSLASPCPLTPSPATPSSAGTGGGSGYPGALLNGNGHLHHDLMSKVSSSLISSSGGGPNNILSASSSGLGGGLPFGLYNMLPGPGPAPPPPSGSNLNHVHPHHHPHHHHHHHTTGMFHPPLSGLAGGGGPHRHPIGTNPHDVNNPLSVNQLTGQCSTTGGSGGGKDGKSSSSGMGIGKETTGNSHAIVSVT